MDHDGGVIQRNTVPTDKSTDDLPVDVERMKSPDIRFPLLARK